jgi:dolichol-phosphate mannosyltransferase
MPRAKLSIVILALNQADRIAETIGAILPVARMFLEDFEIILVDDGSIDATGSIMKGFASRDPKVRVTSNPHPMGDGFSLKTALAAANFDAITLIPGDGSFRADGIARMFRASGAADLVITYRDNRSAQHFDRAVLSHLARLILNVISGFWLANHRSMIVYPVKWLREMPIETNGSGYQVCALISLLRLGLTYAQVPVSLNLAAKGPSRKVRLRDDLALIRTVISFFLSPRNASPAVVRRTQILDILTKKSRVRDK